MTSFECPKCSTELPAYRDAYCPSCREPLEWDEPKPTSIPQSDDRYELRVIRANLAYQESPTYGTFFRVNGKAYVIILLMAVFTIVLSHVAVHERLTLIVVGVWLGFFLRDWGTIRANQRASGMFAKYIDWDAMKKRGMELEEQFRAKE